MTKQLKTIFILLILPILLIQCKKFDEYTKFEMEYEESVVIPSSTNQLLPFNLFTPAIETNSESTFEVNDTRKDLVESIQLTALTLTITEPGNGNFNFLESIEVYISADGLEETKVAWKNSVPANSANELSLETTELNLEAYIKKDQFSLRVKTITDELLSKDYHIDIKTTLFVDAKILGQ